MTIVRISNNDGRSPRLDAAVRSLVHDGDSVAGFELKIAGDVALTPEPTADLGALEELKSR